MAFLSSYQDTTLDVSDSITASSLTGGREEHGLNEMVADGGYNERDDIDLHPWVCKIVPSNNLVASCKDVKATA